MLVPLMLDFRLVINLPGYRQVLQPISVGKRETIQQGEFGECDVQSYDPFTFGASDYYVEARTSMSQCYQGKTALPCHGLRPPSPRAIHHGTNRC